MKKRANYVYMNDLYLESARQSAIISSTNATFMSLDHLLVRNTGSVGLDLSPYIFFVFLAEIERCHNCNITNNLITATGDGGINHNGGDRRSLVPSGESLVFKFLSSRN